MNDHEWRIQRKSTWEATNKIKDSAPFSTAKPHLAAAKSAKTQIEVIDIDDIEYTFCYCITMDQSAAILFDKK